MRLFAPDHSPLTLCVICGFLASASVCECGKPGCLAEPLRDLVRRASVVFEGHVEEPVRSWNRTGTVRNGAQREDVGETRIKVHRVWEMKSGGLEMGNVVSVILSRVDKCARLEPRTLYVFFTELTAKPTVYRTISVPAQTKHSIRKRLGENLCQICAAPKLKTLRNWTVQEGQKATLKCELLSGGKQTKIKWYLNNIEIGGNKTRKIKLKKKGTLSELRLLKVTDADVGTYTCKAVNERGEDAQNASVTVIKAATSTTPSAKTSSHTIRCSEEEKSYCVNGGECFTLNITPNTTKRLCRCPQGFTGNRCQTKVPVRVTKHEQHHGIELMEAEELYQKRVLTITGICIALLVVGIMCVVAYCKTKKQRQKLHDRLRQSIRNRNAMADVGNGPQHLQKHHTPPQTLQLLNYAQPNPAPSEHVMEKEKETSFTFCQNTMCSQSPTAATHASSQCWSNNIVSDSRPVLAQNSRNGTPSHRGRLNATGGAREVSAYPKNSRETADSYKETPNSQRDVSNVTATHPSPVKPLSPATPSSPPSEISTALPSLATSVPSMAMSPSVGDERPLLYLTPPPLREKSEPSRARQLRNSAHYNHGLEEISPPTSPQHTPDEELLNTIQEGDCSMPSSASHSPMATHISKRTNPDAKNTQEEQKGSSEDSSESSSSESETEEERMAEDKPFLLQNPGALGMAVLGLELTDSSRTNTALHLSPQDDLQSRLTSVMAKQDPIAV